MPSLNEFLMDFTWKELTLVLITVVVIVLAREQGRIFRRKKNV
jgi:hypothetical protein